MSHIAECLLDIQNIKDLNAAILQRAVEDMRYLNRTAKLSPLAWVAVMGDHGIDPRALADWLQPDGGFTDVADVLDISPEVFSKALSPEWTKLCDNVRKFRAYRRTPNTTALTNLSAYMTRVQHQKPINGAKCYTQPTTNMLFLFNVTKCPICKSREIAFYQDAIAIEKRDQEIPILDTIPAQECLKCEGRKNWKTRLPQGDIL